MVKVFRGFRVQHNDARGPGDDRYSTCSIHVDDVEVRSGGYSARRGEGWSDL
jgi:hypothetical protein